MPIKSPIWLGGIVCTLTLICFTSAPAGVVFHETFDSDLDNFKQHGGCYDYSFAIVQDPCSDNIDNRVVRVINRMGEDNRVCQDATWNTLQRRNGKVWYKHRAELMPKNKKTRVEPGEDFWIGMRVFVPKTYPSKLPLIHFHVSQIIPPPFDGTDMGLMINQRGQWRLSIRRTPANKDRNDEVLDLGEIERGKWTNWVIHYKRSTTNNGVAQVWKDDVKNPQVNYKGPTSQSSEPQGMWKFGLYRGEFVEPKFHNQEYVVYFDDVKVATGPNQFDAVRPDQAASKCAGSTPVTKPKPPQKLGVDSVQADHQ